MSETRHIPREELSTYFDSFTKRFLQDGSPEAVDVELLEPVLGDQVAVSGARLLGVTYDKQANALEVSLESGNHRTYAPEAVWTIEESDGFVSAIEVVRNDGTREVVSVKRGGLRGRDD
jgi:hypothetical protein